MEEMIFNDRFQDEYAAITRMVGVNEVSAVRFSNTLPCVGTSSLSSCIGFAVYDAEAKVGAVAHVFVPKSGEGFQQVAQMLARTVEAADLVGGSKYVLYAFNGRQPDSGRNGPLESAIGEAADALMQSGRVMKFEHREEHNFVLDTRSGDIFTANSD